MSAGVGERRSVGDTAIICFSHLRWNFVYQRPQHLMSRAARSYRVWYFEEPIYEPGVQSRLEIRCDDTSGVHVAVPILSEGIEADEVILILRGLVSGFLESLCHRRRIAWYYTPIALAFSDPINFDVCIYDNMDELSAFAGAPPELLKLEQALFSRADVVFTGGQSLYEAKRDLHPNIHPFPSSVDVAHFAQARSLSKQAEPADQRAIGSPRLGFFGVIDERLNAKLLGEVARIRQDWQLVVIGPVAKIDPSTLPRLPNIHWLGSKSYKDLPKYLAGWDVGVMPFALNESTRFISPTKTPEFLAAGVPVVSTPIADVVRPYGERRLVQIAEGPDAFVREAERLLHAPRKEWLRAVDQHLAGTSWNLTWAGMHALIQQAANTVDRTVSPDLGVIHV